MEGYIFYSRHYKQYDKHVSILKRIYKCVGAKYEQGGHIRPTLGNRNRFIIPQPIYSQKMNSPNATVKDFDTIVFNMEVYQ